MRFHGGFARVILVVALVLGLFVPGGASAAAPSSAGVDPSDNELVSGDVTYKADTAEPKRWRRFQTPSRNIRCAYQDYEGYPVSIRCDIGTGLNPEPARDCELDWTGAELGKRRRGYAVCAGDTVADPDARVLQYGTKWRRNGLTCISRKRGLTCRSRNEHGFFLSRAAWDTW